MVLVPAPSPTSATNADCVVSARPWLVVGVWERDRDSGSEMRASKASSAAFCLRVEYLCCAPAGAGAGVGVWDFGMLLFLLLLLI